MTDPFSVVTGVVGIIGVALRNTRQIYDFVSGIKGAPEAVATLSGDLDSLANVLEQLLKLTKDPSQALFVVPLKESLERCIAALGELELSVKPYVEGLKDGKSKWKRFAWNFKEKEIAALQSRLGSCRDNLQLAILLGVMTQHASGSKDIRENFQKLQRTAEGDRWSTAGSAIYSSEAAGSDYGYALKRFLLDHESDLGSQIGDFPVLEDIPEDPDPSPSHKDHSSGGGTKLPAEEKPQPSRADDDDTVDGERPMQVQSSDFLKGTLKALVGQWRLGSLGQFYEGGISEQKAESGESACQEVSSVRKGEALPGASDTTDQGAKVNASGEPSPLSPSEPVAHPEDSDRLLSVPDYYMEGSIADGSLVYVVYAYKARDIDEQDIEFGDILEISHIWNDGWAHGRKMKVPDNAVTDTSTSPLDAYEELRAFPLACVTLSQKKAASLRMEQLSSIRPGQ